MVEDTHPEIEQKSRLITILGPTATGKTRRAVEVAKAFDGEIISADSRQVYRGMDLGTGKDLAEYSGVPYHLIDICDAGEKYNLHRYLSDFHSSLNDLWRRGKQPVVCGGTGMYLESALSGLDLPEVPENKELRDRLENFSLPELTEILSGYKKLHNSTDVDTTKRAVRAIEIEEYYRTHPEVTRRIDREKTRHLDSLNIGIDIPREVRRERITERLKKRLEEGMIEEIQSLLKKGVKPADLIYYGLEYKYLTLYVTGKISYEEMYRKLEIAIHQFAKRQMTWFRGMERRGFTIHWLPYNLEDEEFIDRVRELLEAK